MLKDWLNSTKEIAKETEVFLKTNEKYFSSVVFYIIFSSIFLGVIYFVTICAIEFIDEKIAPIKFLRFKPYEGYIYAFPDSDRAKNYRLKFKKTENGFYMFFPNGGSIYFEDCEEFNLEGDSFSCYTEKDTRDWEFRCYERDIKEWLRKT